MRGSTFTIGSDTHTPGTDPDGILAKYDSTGNFIWSRALTAPFSDVIVNDMAYHNGFIYACGLAEGTVQFGNGVTLSAGSAGDAFLAKFDTLGNALWAVKGGQNARQDFASGVAVDALGNVYITGMCTSFFTNSTFGHLVIPTGFNEIFVVKYTPNGVPIWARSSTGVTSNDRAHDIATDQRGGVYITGEYEETITFGSFTFQANPIGFNSAFVSKLDTAGNILWGVGIPSQFESFGEAIDADTLGNVFIAGEFNGDYYGLTDTIPAGTGRHHFAMNLHADGTLVFEQQYKRAREVKANQKGSAYFFGDVGGSFTSSVYISKLTATGIETLYKTGGGPLSDYALSGNFDPNSNQVYIGGYFGLQATYGNTTIQVVGNQDLFMAQLSDNTLEVNIQTTPTCADSCAGSIAITPSGGVPPYTFHWSDGTTTSMNNDLCVGNYQVTVKDALQDSLVVSANVAVSEVIDTSLTQSGLLLSAGPNYQYQWYRDGIALNGATNQTLMVDTNGVYRVALTSLSGCSQFSEAITIAYDCNTVLASLTNPSLCVGEILTATASDSIPNASYSWQIFNSIFNGEQFTIVADSAGIFNVTLFVNTPLCDKDSTFHVVVHDDYFQIDSITICAGDSAFFAGEFQHLGGTYTDSLFTINGCDSIHQLILQVIPIPETNLAPITICSGDSALIFGTYQTTAGTYVDSLTSMQGCDSLVQQMLVVASNPSIQFITSIADSMCVDEGVMLLPIPSPSGGVFTGNGVTNGNAFDPALAEAGEHLITYSFTNSFGCFAADSFMITVVELPNIVFDTFANTSVCMDQGVINLPLTTPSNGLFSGPGVNGSSFDPAQAGEGIHTIYYTVASAFGCMATDSLEIQVNESPLVSVAPFPFDTICESISGPTPPVPLPQGTPAGGIYSGLGVVDSFFHPDLVGPGISNVTYTYTNAAGCASAVSFPILVGFCYVSVQELEQNLLQAEIYPNPFEGQTSIYFESELSGNYDLFVFDATGRTIYKMTALQGNTFTLTSEALGSGLRFVQLIDRKTAQPVYNAKILAR